MRRLARQPRLHRVSRGVRRRIRTRRSNRVAATGSRSRMPDFASAFLPRDQSTATDFESRLVGRVTPCAPRYSAAEDCPPYHVIAAPSELVRVRKLPQDWIMSRRPEVFDYSTKNRIQQRIRVQDVQIEGDQFAVQMQFRFIIERVAVVKFQPLLQRPRDDIAQRVKV